MAVGNGELMQQCFLKHSRKEIRRMKEDERKIEEGKKFERRDTERSKAGMKEKEVPTPIKTK